MTAPFYKRFSFYLIFLSTIAFNNAHSSGQPSQSDQYMRITNPTYKPWIKSPTYSPNSKPQLILYEGEEDIFGRCYTHALVKNLGLAPENAKLLETSTCADLVRLGILGKYYEQIEQPVPGALGVYCLPDGTIQHFANVTDSRPNKHSQQCTVLSKLGSFPHVVEHDIFDTDFYPYVESPLEYGKIVHFYNRKNEFKNNQLTLKAIQQDIQNSDTIQRNLAQSRRSLLTLANGHNVSFVGKFDNYSLQDKTWLLLKRSMGLNVNATRNHNGDTPLSLAAKRGDSKMVKTLLMLGADTSIQNKQGLTACELAEETCMTKLQDPQFSSADWSKYQATVKVLTL